MPIVISRIVVLLCAASLAACTSLRIVPDRSSVPDTGSGPPPHQKLVPNDAVVVTTTDGRQLAFLVTSTSAETIEGVSQGVPVRLQRDQIARIERHEPDAAKTMILVAAIALGIYIVIEAVTAIGAAALASSL